MCNESFSLTYLNDCLAFTSLAAVRLLYSGTCWCNCSERPSVNFVLKADTKGTAEAIKDAIMGLSGDVVSSQFTPCDNIVCDGYSGRQHSCTPEHLHWLLYPLIVHNNSLHSPRMYLPVHVGTT